MVHIERVDLSARGVTLPSYKVGMVVAQPFLSLSDTEPFRCVPASREDQLAGVAETLRVSRLAVHGATKTHFTIFPEYSIPGLDGIALVQAALSANDWPTETIVIGGIDALSKAEFAQVAASQNTYIDGVHNSLDRVAANEWINCQIIWVKGANGVVERWLQPKLYPAWPEQDITYQNMFRGASIFNFKGSLDNGLQYRFCSLICFDWISTIENRKAWQWPIDDLREQAANAGAELSLSWFFVIQHNPRPSHHAFLGEVLDFFNQTIFPNVHRDRSCVIFANTAGKHVPGKVNDHGASSLVFSGQTLFADPKSPPTFSKGGLRFRESGMLSHNYDVFLREGGECVHSFSQINPGSLVAGAATRTIALDHAYVFPLRNTNDPRAPSLGVPACVKWINDELDEIQNLAQQYDTVPLAEAIDAAHQTTVGNFRILRPQDVSNSIMLANSKSTEENADMWDQTQSQALQHLVHTLDILSLAYPASDYGVAPAHGTITFNGRAIDILAIRGVSHEECLRHSEAMVSHPRRQLLLVSRDDDNTGWNRRFRSILQGASPKLGDETNITDPSSGSLHLPYQTLLDAYRASQDAAGVGVEISAKLS